MLDWEVTYVGHDEPLLRLTWGAWIFLPKAQTDLIFRFWATIQHVGTKFYGIR